MEIDMKEIGLIIKFMVKEYLLDNKEIYIKDSLRIIWYKDGGYLRC
jgi:hypothetical protein